MEKFALFFLPLFVVLLLLRLMVIPIRRILRLGIHTCSGLVCLLLLNSVSSFTGILFPVNAATVALAGLTGLPGIAAMALLTLIT